MQFIKLAVEKYESRLDSGVVQVGVEHFDYSGHNQLKPKTIMIPLVCELNTS